MTRISTRTRYRYVIRVRLVRNYVPTDLMPILADMARRNNAEDRTVARGTVMIPIPVLVPRTEKATIAY
eukprot:scaffold2315_cov29-Prasinocladus_malaysianus.AAC.1